MIGMKFARGSLARFLLSLSCYRLVTVLPVGNSTTKVSRLIVKGYKMRPLARRLHIVQ